MRLIKRVQLIAKPAEGYLNDFVCFFVRFSCCNLLSDNKCVQSAIRERGAVLAKCSRAYNHGVDRIATAAPGAAEHKRFRGVDACAPCSSCADLLVPQVLQEPLRAGVREEPAAGIPLPITAYTASGVRVPRF